MNEEHPVSRPPIGFIVEGAGEYQCYPSLFHRILGTQGVCVPRVNAGGYGSILSNLQEHLTDLVVTWHPVSVIVTVDLADALKTKRFENCSRVCDHLCRCVDQWMDGASEDDRLSPIPLEISVVLQMPKFESWFLADLKALSVEEEVPELSIENVDESITDPATLLSRFLPPGKSLKQPRFARGLVSKICTEKMIQRSGSFNKFAREVKKLYSIWEKAAYSDDELGPVHTRAMIL